MKTNFMIVSLFSLVARIISEDGIHVQIKQGLLSGEMLETVTGEYYYSFKGIPYARPPIGKLRFKAPQDPLSWHGTRPASTHGAVCPQVVILTNLYVPGSEDCLFLNVYTSSLTPDKPRSVIVFIHGGSYLFGSGDDDFYGPDFLVTKDVVVVTINYRLDSLGFLSLGTCEVPGNAGLKDQVAALRWVRDNISSFGGDPGSVTIVGESAGAASVTYHLLSPLSKGLFHRAIAMSGVTSCDWGYPYQPVRRAFTLGKKLGLQTKNTEELLDFLQAVPYEKLLNTTSYVLASEKKTDIPLKMQPFTPVIENKDCKDTFISIDPMDALRNGIVNKADVIFGYTERESLILIQQYAKQYMNRYSRYPEMFVPSKILVHSTPDTILRIADKIISYYFGEKTVSVDNIGEFLNYAGNATFVYDIQNFFRKWPKVGSKYFYKFSSYSDRNYFGQLGAEYGVTGASHLDDVFYLFDPKIFNMSLKTNSPAHGMIEVLTTAFSNFAKYGDPTPDSSLGAIWPQYDSDTLAYVDIAEKLTVQYAPDEDDYHFWKSCFEDAGLSF